MQDYKARIEGKLIYQSDIHQHWEQVYRCDGCLAEVEPSQLWQVVIQIAHALTQKDLYVSIHPGCLEMAFDRSVFRKVPKKED